MIRKGYAIMCATVNTFNRVFKPAFENRWDKCYVSIKSLKTTSEGEIFFYGLKTKSFMLNFSDKSYSYSEYDRGVRIKKHSFRNFQNFLLAVYIEFINCFSENELSFSKLEILDSFKKDLKKDELLKYNLT